METVRRVKAHTPVARIHPAAEPETQAQKKNGKLRRKAD